MLAIAVLGSGMRRRRTEERGWTFWEPIAPEYNILAYFIKRRSFAMVMEFGGWKAPRLSVLQIPARLHPSFLSLHQETCTSYLEVVLRYPSLRIML